MDHADQIAESGIAVAIRLKGGEETGEGRASHEKMPKALMSQEELEQGAMVRWDRDCVHTS